MTMDEAESKLDRYGISSGGKAKPKDCLAKQKTAFIIPYRNRESHLITWLSHLHPILILNINKFNPTKEFKLSFKNMLTLDGI